IGGSAESAAAVDARAGAPVERSDEHSARAAESVAEVDGRTGRIVQRDCHTRSEAGFEEGILRRTPHLPGVGKVVSGEPRTAVHLDTCRKTRDSSGQTDQTS